MTTDPMSDCHWLKVQDERIAELEAEIAALREDRDAWKASAEMLMRRAGDDAS